jgi:hypothetical protein
MPEPPVPPVKRPEPVPVTPPALPTFAAPAKLSAFYLLSPAGGRNRAGKRRKDRTAQIRQFFSLGWRGAWSHGSAQSIALSDDACDLSHILARPEGG